MTGVVEAIFSVEMSTVDDTEHAAIIAELTELARARGRDETDFDELVHDLYSRRASNVNNDGLEAQIAFIVAELGPESARVEISGS
jgi:hypothetical protein